MCHGACVCVCVWGSGGWFLSPFLIKHKKKGRKEEKKKK